MWLSYYLNENWITYYEKQLKKYQKLYNNKAISNDKFKTLTEQIKDYIKVLKQTNI